VDVDQENVKCVIYMYVLSTLLESKQKGFKLKLLLFLNGLDVNINNELLTKYTYSKGHLTICMGHLIYRAYVDYCIDLLIRTPYLL